MMKSTAVVLLNVACRPRLAAHAAQQTLKCAALLMCLSPLAHAAPPLPKDGLTFYASFDNSTDAEFSKGDAKLYTAQSLKREKITAGLQADGASRKTAGGQAGGWLSFSKKTPHVVFYRGAGNVPYSPDGFSATYSMWLKTDPAQMLPAGYVDPLQVTDKKWNDAALFIDFTKETPRQFRLGVFSDYKFWNPENTKWEQIAAPQRPMISAVKLPFSQARWTHVAFTLSGVNHKKSASSPAPACVAKLYLNGNPIGVLKRAQRFSWQADKVVLMLGIAYVGGIDELAIYNRALSQAEIRTIAKAELP